MSGYRMKVIISHDVDHLKVSDHLNDAFVPKFVLRNLIELGAGKVGVREFFMRNIGLFKNKWENIEELMNYNDAKGVPATFFVGMAKGLGLNYSNKDAEPWVRRIIARGFEVGVHGIAYEKLEDMKREHATFAAMSGLSEFGIRMHYLRANQETYSFLAESGYTYDSTEFAMKAHYKIKGMVEFPLQIMDSKEFRENRAWQIRTLQEAKESTLEKINKAKNSNVQFLSILFHDWYFNSQFASWRDWYCWVVEYLLNEGYNFVSYKQAMREITESRN